VRDYIKDRTIADLTSTDPATQREILTR